MKKMRNRSKMQKPLLSLKWNRQFKFFHNKGSSHFYLGVGKRGDLVAGHDLTTHPAVNQKRQVKKKYLKLAKNPNPEDKRTSYLDKKLRKNVRMHFEDTYNKRLLLKKKWKLSKIDKRIIKKIDRKNI